MDSAAIILQALTALVALVAGGGASIYVVQRRVGGRPSSPGGAHDETVEILREQAHTLTDILGAVERVEHQIEKANGTSGREHAELRSLMIGGPR